MRNVVGERWGKPMVVRPHVIGSCELRLAMVKPQSLLLVGALFPICVWAQVSNNPDQTVSVSEIRGAVPASGAHIMRFFVDKPKAHSDNVTGNLHIVYSDKTEVTIALPPAVDGMLGFDHPAIAKDNRTIAWTELYDAGAQSYSIDLTIAVYRSGKKILHISQGQTVWNWIFLDGGKRLVGVWGATHGQQGLDYQLYDSRTGKVLAEVFGNDKTECLNTGAPKWAEQAIPEQTGCN